jgi:hypothetical protein
MERYKRLAKVKLREESHAVFVEVTELNADARVSADRMHVKASEPGSWLTRSAGR